MILKRWTRNAEKIFFTGELWLDYHILSTQQSSSRKITYYWVNKVLKEFVLRKLRLGTPKIIVDWYNFTQEVYVKIIELFHVKKKN